MGQKEGSWEWLLGSLLVRNGPILHTNSQDTFPAQVFHNPASSHFSNLIPDSTPQATCVLTIMDQLQFLHLSIPPCTSMS